MRTNCSVGSWTGKRTFVDQLLRFKQGLSIDWYYRVSANFLVSTSVLCGPIWRKPSEGCTETLYTVFAILLWACLVQGWVLSPKQEDVICLSMDTCSKSHVLLLSCEVAESHSPVSHESESSPPCHSGWPGRETKDGLPHWAPRLGQSKPATASYLVKGKGR